MSLQFSDSTNKSGIVELIDRNCKTNEFSYPIEEKVSEVNLGMDEVFQIATLAAGWKWQIDDSNYEDYPIITTDLVSGQRDYPFTVDEDGSLILDVYKVMVKDRSGVYHEVFPVDVQSETPTEIFYNGLDQPGQPQKYDKTANALFFDVVPDYDAEDGVMMYINRESVRFTVDDTTKKPGFIGTLHEYLVLRASYTYARTNSLANKNDLKADMFDMRQRIIDTYGTREKDVKNKLTSSTTQRGTIMI